MPVERLIVSTQLSGNTADCWSEAPMCDPSVSDAEFTFVMCWSVLLLSGMQRVVGDRAGGSVIGCGTTESGSLFTGCCCLSATLGQKNAAKRRASSGRSRSSSTSSWYVVSLDKSHSIAPCLCTQAQAISRCSASFDAISAVSIQMQSAMACSEWFKRYKTHAMSRH